MDIKIKFITILCELLKKAEDHKSLFTLTNQKIKTIGPLFSIRKSEGLLFTNDNLFYFILSLL